MENKFYGDNGQEILTATDWEEALEEALENGAEYPIRIYEYKPKEIFGKNYYKNFLENFLEDLDQEYADPDADFTKPTEKMLEAAKCFIDIMREEYINFWLEKTGVVREYQDKNNYIEMKE